MLGLGTLALLRHPDQLALVRDDPAAVGHAVEELLRSWASCTRASRAPRPRTSRWAASRSRPTRSWSWRWPRRTATRASSPADRLDVTRDAGGHLAFGHGVHHCLGAPLARMEMRIAFPALLRRFPRLALAVPFEEVEFRAFHFIYGLQALPVTW